MADTPFGASFGNPRQYMGSTNIGQVLGAFLADKAGLIDLTDPTQKAAFDKGGLKGMFNQGLSNQLGLPTPAGSAPPPQFKPGDYNVNPNYSLAPVAPPVGATGKDMDVYTSGNYGGPAVPTATTPQVTSEYTNPQAQRDFNPYTPQTGYNTMLANGKEYQNVQGYGSFMDKAKMFAGLFA
jgi:hypothetical protein